jgi:hypothetical protein
MTTALVEATWASETLRLVSRNGSAVIVNPITRPKGANASPMIHGGGTRSDAGMWSKTSGDSVCARGFSRSGLQIRTILFRAVSRAS